MKPFKIAAPLLVNLLLFSSTAMAHITMKDEMPITKNWSGFYAGVNVGAVNHTMTITDTEAASFLASWQQVSNPSITAGLMGGYRQQLDLNNVTGVYGAEISANVANANFQKQYGSAFAIYQINSKNTLNAFCLLELTGGIATENVLLFVAAGLSWVDITGSSTNQSGIPFFNSFSLDQQQFGTALGAGIEYAYSKTISFRFKADVITPITYTTTDNVGNSYQIANNIVQGTFGVMYKFQ